MNLFCGGHVIYVGIARQGGTMRTYTPLVFIRAYTPLVFMHLTQADTSIKSSGMQNLELPTDSRLSS
jgi:hypothetical protein